jgi:hypothetical protein
MMTVTLDALEEVGFQAFGWVRPGETIGGHSLSQEAKYPFGAFVYEMKQSEPTFFALVPHTDEQLDEFYESHTPRGTDMTESRLFGGSLISSSRAILRRMKSDMKESSREQRMMDVHAPLAGPFHLHLHAPSPHTESVACCSV